MERNDINFYRSVPYYRKIYVTPLQIFVTLMWISICLFCSINRKTKFHSCFYNINKIWIKEKKYLRKKNLFKRDKRLLSRTISAVCFLSWKSCMAFIFDFWQLRRKFFLKKVNFETLKDSRSLKCWFLDGFEEKERVRQGKMT
jgi:hypothetical protein